MATVTQVKELKDQFELLTEVEISELIHSGDWGSINFDGAESDLGRLYALCNHLKVLPVEQLPDDIAAGILTETGPVAATLEKVRDFTIEQADPSGVRDQLVAEVKKNVDRLYKYAHIYVPYLAYQQGEIQSNIQQLSKSVADAKQLLSNAETETQGKRGEIDKIVRAAKDASASVGVAHFTADFEGEATTLETEADKWLNVTMVLAAISLGAAVYFLASSPALGTTAEAIQYVSSKVLILVLLITATLWCGNIYKATKHQAAANKFKGNSLKTFQAFVNAAEDDAVKDAVLIETTRAIFSESATGYIKNDGGAVGDRGSKVVEVVRNSAQAASSASKVGE